ncbi:MAG TPA: flagellar M-ring protein FliF C-terminal domain-containing protein, partial [Candidatus Baltobacteraceae bacterium]|nr:flagellar M-ring protein FliF C-terminal domain-containing protein [Candidatus Baltobacteraceae bacterium]
MSLGSLWTRLRGLTPRHRFFAAALAAAAFASVLLALALQRDARVDLFAVALRSEQITEVVERLADWNVAFVTTPDNVRVDAHRRNELLLRLSLAGVPHAHLGGTRELLEKVNPLTPQSVLDAQQRDGLADDLAAGLRGLPGVADARVIIAPAQEGAFVGETSREASASVRVVLAPGASLSYETAAGIRAFVAAGVPGLEAKRVALLDDRGAVPADGAPAGDRDEELANSLQSVLDAAFGAGATIVRVHQAYDLRSRHVEERIDKPLGAHPLHSTNTDERYSSVQKRYSKASANQENGSDIEETRTDIPAGRLVRTSVAVAVDTARHLALGKIRSLAVATLGLETSRGDRLSVEEMAFAVAPVRGASFAVLALDALARLVPPLFVLVAAFAALRFAGRPAARAYLALRHSIDVRRAS